VAVGVPVAQDLMGYCPMSFYPVLRALEVMGKVYTSTSSGGGGAPRPAPSLSAEAILAALREELGG
jgi:hypothetical protein